MGVVALITAILKAFPIVDKWLGGLISQYNKWKVESHDKAFTDGLVELISKHDQRGLEGAARMNTGANPDQSEIITRSRSK